MSREGIIKDETGSCVCYISGYKLIKPIMKLITILEMEIEYISASGQVRQGVETGTCAGFPEFLLMSRKNKNPG